MRPRSGAWLGEALRIVAVADPMALMLAVAAAGGAAGGPGAPSRGRGAGKDLCGGAEETRMGVGEPLMVDKSLVIRLDGIFDLAAAAEIQRALAGSPDGAEVYVDLSQVREFHDRGVAVLADVIKTSGHPISVRGLRQHQYRMLRYLGVESAALDPGLSPRRGPTPPVQTAGEDGLA